jgi:hypothetical protein
MQEHATAVAVENKNRKTIDEVREMRALVFMT